MIAWAGACTLVLGFMLLLKQLKVVALSRALFLLVGDALSAMGDRRLSDEDKERAMRKIAGQLIARLGLILAAFGVALAVPFAVLWVVDQFGVQILAGSLALTVSPLFITLSSGLIVGWLFFARDKSQKEDLTYSLPEQLLHRVAFCTAPLQLAFSRLEDRMLGRKLDACDTERPVFVTGLPRAGTTLVLECCARVPELASHCYLDMPFLLSPVLWSKVSGPFRRSADAKERAHGDGMMITTESPEALEEVVWLTFFRKPYLNDRIRVWSKTARNPQFFPYFERHMAKIIRLRSKGSPAARYVSKNNLNISRLGTLRSLFPGCAIVVPFREPIAHCESLLRQHRNFLALHNSDPFSAEYMRQIGHFDFGVNLCPIDFDGWLDKREHRDPLTLGFWLEYWTAAYGHVLEEHSQHVDLLDYDRLCREPKQGLSALSQAIGLPDPAALVASGEAIRPLAARAHLDEDWGETLLRAEQLHQRLIERSLQAASAEA
jgi:hypothetical protein